MPTREQTWLIVFQLPKEVEDIDQLDDGTDKAHPIAEAFRV